MTDEKHEENQDGVNSEAETRARRVRRTSKVEAEAAPASTTAAETSPEIQAESPPRRPRRTANPGREPSRRGGDRGPRPSARAASRGGVTSDGGSPLLSTLAASRAGRKGIHRQDPIGPLPETPKAEPKKSPDQMMLIWHPAPKAAVPPARREVKALTAKEAMKAKLAKQAPQRKDATKPIGAGDLDPSWIEATGDAVALAVRAAGERGEALVKAWLDTGNGSAIAALAALDDAPSRARKAARRALNVLRSRGVVVETVSAVSPKVVVSDEASECSASFIPPDGNGTTFYSFSQRLPGGRYRVADVMIHESSGIVHATLGHLAGKHIRKWRDRVEESFGIPPIPVPLDWAKQAVAEGRARNDASKQLVPLGFDSCLVLAGPRPSDKPPHPLAALLHEPPTAAETSDALVDSDKLHNEPEFASWGVERSALSELVAKVGERLSGKEVEDRTAVDKALEEETAAAVDRWFSPERREQIAIRLVDAAVSIRVRRGDAEARRILALAEAVRRAGLVNDPPRENPFLRAFFQKGMAMLARENQGTSSRSMRSAPSE